jgi:hypothetical protein
MRGLQFPELRGDELIIVKLDGMLLKELEP